MKPAERFVVSPSEKERRDQVYYQMAGKKRRAHITWYRGAHTNFHPVRASLFESDAFESYVGKGWLPAAPFIDRNTDITAFGSCFAAEATKFLVHEGYKVLGKDLKLNAHVVRSGEGIVNTAALRQQFEWALAGASPLHGTWHDKDGKELSADEDAKDATRRIFLTTEVFVFTLGLSELWFDKETGDPFWRAVPCDAFDQDRHGFRVLGAEENRRNLARVYELIRAYRPEASIVLTLSPVPLAATFRPVSCITANAVSKASLRIAIDDLMREHADDPRLFYFPSYEMVTSVIPDAYEDDLRHPTPAAVATIMQLFKRHFLC